MGSFALFVGLAYLSCCVSVFFCSAMICCYLWLPQVRTFLIKVLFILSICDLCSSLSIMIPTATLLASYSEENGNRSSTWWFSLICRLQSSLYTFSNTASFIWMTLVSLTLYFTVVRYRQHMWKYMTLFHMIAWPLPVLSVLYLNLVNLNMNAFKGDTGKHRSMEFEKDKSENTWCFIPLNGLHKQWNRIGGLLILYFIPLLLCLLLMMSFYIRTLGSIWHRLKTETLLLQHRYQTYHDAQKSGESRNNDDMLIPHSESLMKVRSRHGTNKSYWSSPSELSPPDPGQTDNYMRYQLLMRELMTYLFLMFCVRVWSLIDPIKDLSLRKDDIDNQGGRFGQFVGWAHVILCPLQGAINTLLFFNNASVRARIKQEWLSTGLLVPSLRKFDEALLSLDPAHPLFQQWFDGADVELMNDEDKRLFLRNKRKLFYNETRQQFNIVTLAVITICGAFCTLCESCEMFVDQRLCWWAGPLSASLSAGFTTTRQYTLHRADTITHIDTDRSLMSSCETIDSGSGGAGINSRTLRLHRSKKNTGSPSDREPLLHAVPDPVVVMSDTNSSSGGGGGMKGMKNSSRQDRSQSWDRTYQNSRRDASKSLALASPSTPLRRQKYVSPAAMIKRKPKASSDVGTTPEISPIVDEHTEMTTALLSGSGTTMKNGIHHQALLPKISVSMAGVGAGDSQTDSFSTAAIVLDHQSGLPRQISLRGSLVGPRASSATTSSGSGGALLSLKRLFGGMKLPFDLSDRSERGSSTFARRGTALSKIDQSWPYPANTGPANPLHITAQRRGGAAGKGSMKETSQTSSYMRLSTGAAPPDEHLRRYAGGVIGEHSGIAVLGAHPWDLDITGLDVIPHSDPLLIGGDIGATGAGIVPMSGLGAGLAVGAGPRAASSRSITAEGESFGWELESTGDDRSVVDETEWTRMNSIKAGVTGARADSVASESSTATTLRLDSDTMSYAGMLSAKRRVQFAQRKGSSMDDESSPNVRFSPAVVEYSTGLGSSDLRPDYGSTSVSREPSSKQYGTKSSTTMTTTTDTDVDPSGAGYGGDLDIDEHGMISQSLPLLAMKTNTPHSDDDIARKPRKKRSEDVGSSLFSKSSATMKKQQPQSATHLDDHYHHSKKTTIKSDPKAPYLSSSSQTGRTKKKTMHHSERVIDLEQCRFGSKILEEYCVFVTTFNMADYKGSTATLIDWLRAELRRAHSQFKETDPLRYQKHTNRMSRWRHSETPFTTRTTTMSSIPSTERSPEHTLGSISTMDTLMEEHSRDDENDDDDDDDEHTDGRSTGLMKKKKKKKPSSSSSVAGLSVKTEKMGVDGGDKSTEFRSVLSLSRLTKHHQFMAADLPNPHYTSENGKKDENDLMKKKMDLGIPIASAMGSRSIEDATPVAPPMAMSFDEGLTDRSSHSDYFPSLPDRHGSSVLPSKFPTFEQSSGSRIDLVGSGSPSMIADVGGPTSKTALSATAAAVAAGVGGGAGAGAGGDRRRTTDHSETASADRTTPSLDDLHNVDIYVFGAQELGLESDAMNKAVLNVIGPEKYTVLTFKRLHGLFITCIVKNELRCGIDKKKVQTSSTRTGIGNFYGNKGAVAISFCVNRTAFCFVNAHLAASRSAKFLKDRIEDLVLIVSGLSMGHYKQVDFTQQFHALFLLGDLNFRLVDVGWDEAVNIIKEGLWLKLLSKDELLQIRAPFVRGDDLRDSLVDFPDDPHLRHSSASVADLDGHGYNWPGFDTGVGYLDNLGGHRKVVFTAPKQQPDYSVGGRAARLSEPEPSESATMIDTDDDWRLLSSKKRTKKTVEFVGLSDKEENDEDDDSDDDGRKKRSDKRHRRRKEHGKEKSEDGRKRRKKSKRRKSESKKRKKKKKKSTKDESGRRKKIRGKRNQREGSVSSEATAQSFGGDVFAMDIGDTRKPSDFIADEFEFDASAIIAADDDDDQRTTVTSISTAATAAAPMTVSDMKVDEDKDDGSHHRHRLSTEIKMDENEEEYESGDDESGSDNSSSVDGGGSSSSSSSSSSSGSSSNGSIEESSSRMTPSVPHVRAPKKSTLSTLTGSTRSLSHIAMGHATADTLNLGSLDIPSRLIITRTSVKDLTKLPESEAIGVADVLDVSSMGNGGDEAIEPSGKRDLLSLANIADGQSDRDLTAADSLRVMPGDDSVERTDIDTPKMVPKKATKLLGAPSTTLSKSFSTTTTMSTSSSAVSSLSIVDDSKASSESSGGIVKSVPLTGSALSRPKPTHEHHRSLLTPVKEMSSTMLSIFTGSSKGGSSSSSSSEITKRDTSDLSVDTLGSPPVIGQAETSGSHSKLTLHSPTDSMGSPGTTASTTAAGGIRGGGSVSFHTKAGHHPSVSMATGMPTKKQSTSKKKKKEPVSEEFLRGISPILQQFVEGKITFPPTYKFCPGESEYHRKRVPAWCDRILWSKPPHPCVTVSQDFYQCAKSTPKESDHRPVFSQFVVSYHGSWNPDNHSVWIVSIRNLRLTLANDTQAGGGGTSSSTGLASLISASASSPRELSAGDTAGSSLMVGSVGGGTLAGPTGVASSGGVFNMAGIPSSGVAAYPAPPLTPSSSAAAATTGTSKTPRSGKSAFGSFSGSKLLQAFKSSMGHHQSSSFLMREATMSPFLTIYSPLLKRTLRTPVGIKCRMPSHHSDLMMDVGHSPTPSSGVVGGSESTMYQFKMHDFEIKFSETSVISNGCLWVVVRDASLLGDADMLGCSAIPLIDTYAVLRKKTHSTLDDSDSMAKRRDERMSVYEREEQLQLNTFVRFSREVSLNTSTRGELTGEVRLVHVRPGSKLAKRKLKK